VQPQEGKTMTLTARFETGAAAPVRRPLHVAFACDAAELAAAQRLRYEVFREAFGAHMHGAEDGLDRDRFDPFCQHLIVWDADRAVACTRILTSETAPAAGGFYSQDEFDLAPLLARAGRVMEVGRTCVAAGYRKGPAIGLLWAGIAGFLLERRYHGLIGCGSISMGPGLGPVRALIRNIHARALVEPACRVRPLDPLPTYDGVACKPCPLPPLIAAYLRLGARIAGDACLDREFMVADLPIYLAREDVAPRYARRFLRQ